MPIDSVIELLDIEVTWPKDKTQINDYSLQLINQKNVIFNSYQNSFYMYTYFNEQFEIQGTLFEIEDQGTQ